MAQWNWDELRRGTVCLAGWLALWRAQLRNLLQNIIVNEWTQLDSETDNAASLVWTRHREGGSQWSLVAREYERPAKWKDYGIVIRDGVIIYFNPSALVVGEYSVTRWQCGQGEISVVIINSSELRCNCFGNWINIYLHLHRLLGYNLKVSPTSSCFCFLDKYDKRRNLRNLNRPLS